MYLTYIDEVKYQKDKEPFYWLCGLAFPEESIKFVENCLSEIAQEYFGSAILSNDTEFHAKDIVHGKATYKGHDLNKRFDLYISLLEVLEQCPELKKIEIRIEPEKMVANKDHQDMAFMFFVEKVNSLMKAMKSTALLITDHDKDMVNSNVTSLSTYKEKGTKYQFGSEINCIVDTIHHTHSHHSRLIQMADIYTYTMALQPKQGMKYPREDIIQYTRDKTNLCNASKYKYWPTE
ncbi:hypothetical protein CRYPA_1442 [uncultured Candidatus Thioglobus sp.]|nr:hypothetical protein CRYPA_1442 [uncultured Candidatus Thioglobus sp.]